MTRITPSNSSSTIAAAVNACLRAIAPERCVIGFSGGLDSTVLLHAAVQQRQALQADGVPAPDLLAVHVNHGLQENADDWVQHCAEVCRQWAVECQTARIDLGNKPAGSLEAAARSARYEVFSKALLPCGQLLTAHHQDDQAETLLLNLMRGSGVAGLAAMPAVKKQPWGLQHRPLLDFSKNELRSYAQAHNLDWIEDPSNTNTDFRRNHLRHRVVPALLEAWPQANQSIAQAAQWQSEALQLHNEVAESDLAQLRRQYGTSPIEFPTSLSGEADSIVIDLASLLQLSAARQRNVLRYAYSQLSLAMPPQRRWQAIEQLLRAKADAVPVVRWADAELRRYKARLYLSKRSPASLSEVLSGQSYCFQKAASGWKCPLPAPYGQLRLLPASSAKDSKLAATNTAPIELPNDFSSALLVRARQGGERYFDVASQQHKSLKNWLQLQNMPPWQRPQLPLVFWRDQLLACADVVLSRPKLPDSVALNRWYLQWQA